MEESQESAFDRIADRFPGTVITRPDDGGMDTGDRQCFGESRHGLFVILDIANFSLRSATELMNTTLH